jgi:hypothetical protein
MTNILYILFGYCIVTWVATIVDVIRRPQEAWDDLADLISESEVKTFLPRWFFALVAFVMFCFMIVLAPIYKTEQWIKLLTLWYYSCRVKWLRRRIIGNNRELHEKLNQMSTEEENRYWRLLAANLEKEKQEQ